MERLACGFFLLLCFGPAIIQADSLSFSHWHPSDQSGNWKVSADGSKATFERRNDQYALLFSPSGVNSSLGDFIVDVEVPSGPVNDDAIFGFTVGTSSQTIFVDWRWLSVATAPNTQCAFPEIPIQNGMAIHAINLDAITTNGFLYHQNFGFVNYKTVCVPVYDEWDLQRAVDYGNTPWKVGTTYRVTISQDGPLTSVNVLDLNAKAPGPSFPDSFQFSLYHQTQPGPFGLFALGQKGILFSNPTLDRCPNDPFKTEPLVCGCGHPETKDTDFDGALDCIDECPTDGAKTLEGQCGCFYPDTDTDGDGVADCLDRCPFDRYKIAPGSCGCGTWESSDSDGDGFADCVDQCPYDRYKVEPGVCGCGTPDVDGDNDGFLDCVDGCVSDPHKSAPGNTGCGAPDWYPPSNYAQSTINVRFGGLYQTLARNRHHEEL